MHVGAICIVDNCLKIWKYVSPFKVSPAYIIIWLRFKVVKVMSSSIPKVSHVTKCTKNIRISTRVLPFLTSSNLSKT